MNHTQRLVAAFDLRRPDRPPILGGWLAAPEHIQALTGCSDDDYWSDPFYWGMEAERVLGSDGVIGIFEPVARGAYRCVDNHVLEHRAEYDMDRVLSEIAALPEPEEMRAQFDEASQYASLKQDLLTKQNQSGEMLWCPADWEIIPSALWYHRYGYENALLLPRLHPEAHRKLLYTSAERGRQNARLRARAIREGIHPKAILTGEDLCSQRGPMISPEFLRREYWPLVEYAIEPVTTAGGRLVWHCDGDVRPIIPDVLRAGFAGLQGFQHECGMELEWIVNLRTHQGDPLLIFGPMSVTTVLPHGTPEEVRAEVNRARETCRDRASLVYFTSNTINPDIPLENLRAYFDTVIESHW
jgi:hypothetical protein